VSRPLRYGPQARAHLEALAEGSQAFAHGIGGAREVGLPFPAEAVRSVAICGMSAAAEAGDLLLGACGERMLLPCSVHSGYTLPGWVGEDTLVVLLSASGATEETLTCASLATERNALCVAATGGGKLGTFYADQGVPVVPVPADGPAGSSTIEFIGVLVGLLDRLGILPLQPGEEDEVHGVLAAALAACGEQSPPAANPARLLADALADSIPVVWGGELTGPLARRWVSRIRLHAKLPAYWSELPQLDHDELMAFPGLPDELAARMRLVLLHDARQQRQVQRRFEHTLALVADRMGGHLTVSADGRGPLARMLDLVVLGDHLAIYMASARGVDAGPDAIAGRLAARLAGTGAGRTARNG
jgi:glucose/mannose-6-phosphate isomerase